jgi:hypothetical protein
MAPYFRYGTSRRFHAEFLAAEPKRRRRSAACGRRCDRPHPDYPGAKRGGARGRSSKRFAAVTVQNFIDVTHWDAMKHLEELVGKEVVVLGTVDDIRVRDKGPTGVRMNHVEIVFFDRDIYSSSGIGDWKGEFVRVTGVPSIYENQHTHKKSVQIKVDLPSQIRLSPVPGLTMPTAKVVP